MTSAPVSKAPSADGVFAADVQRLLEVVEQRLLTSAEGDSPLVTEAAQHLISAGGKRFRPLLVILSAFLGRPRNEDDLVKAACVMELTHVASLYHDDVMDEADVRRAAPSANSRWENTVAILVGDFLFSRASSLVADLGSEFVKLQADTFARLVQGQIAETVGPGDADPREHYLQVLADKTGSLIAASARFGGMISGLRQTELDALSAFGEEFGVVFQLSDDIIDVTSDETGKTPGIDLREGVPTLPTMLLSAREVDGDERLRELLAGDLSDDATLSEAVTLLRAHPVIGEARAEIARRARVARGFLTPLPESEARDALDELCARLVDRNS